RGEASVVAVVAAPAQPASASVQTVPLSAAQAAAPAAPPPSNVGCPTASNAGFALLGRVGPASDRPDRQHGDVNLGLRGYSAAGAAANLMVYSGPADTNAPQFTGMFQPNRIATIQSAYRVNLWYFEPERCNGTPYGCAGPADRDWPVTLIGLATTPGER